MTKEISDKQLKEHDRKRKMYAVFNDFTTNQSMGAWWIGFFRLILMPNSLISQIAAIQIVIWGLGWNFPVWIIIVFLFLRNWATLGFNYYIGQKAKKVGIWKYTSEYNTKKEHLAPFNCELRDQLTEIAKKVGADIKFKDL